MLLGWCGLVYLGLVWVGLLDFVGGGVLSVLVCVLCGRGVGLRFWGLLV